jgi:hypothetical protein
MKEEQLMKKLRRREEEQQKAVEIVMKNLLQVQSLVVQPHESLPSPHNQPLSLLLTQHFYFFLTQKTLHLSTSDPTPA